MIFNPELYPADKTAIVYEDKLNICPQNNYVSRNYLERESPHAREQTNPSPPNKNETHKTHQIQDNKKKD